MQIFLSLFFIALHFLLNVCAQQFYDFAVTDHAGNTIKLDAFRSKPLILIVNVASECGYTHQNYIELQQMYDKYAAKGLEILAFPCNQFGGQEPGTNDQIQDFAKRRYGVTFPVLSKVDVNGESELPLFTYLKRSTGSYDIRWNFSKYLVYNGRPVKFYSHDKSPSTFEGDILYYLNEAEKEL